MDDFYKKFWIENLEEYINSNNNFLKDRKNELKKKFPLTKDDFIIFSNIFFNIRLDMETTEYSISKYISSIKEVVLIPFWASNEIINDNSKKIIELYFKLCQRDLIFIYLKDYRVYNKSEKNFKIWQLLENFRVSKDDEIWKIFLVNKSFWKSNYFENSFFSKLKNFFWFHNNIKEYTKDWANFYLWDLFDNNFEDFINNLDYWIDFNLKMFDKNSYVYNSLKVIEEFDSKISYTNQLKNLYIDIKEQILNKNNHHSEIILSYPINTYIDNYNNYFKIISVLHEKEYITLKELFIYQWNITFIIDKINRFDEHIINFLLPINERVKFENWNFIIDDEIIFWDLKSWEKIKDLIYLIYKAVKKYNTLLFTYKQLKEIFLENEEDFSYLISEKCLNQKSRYTNLKNNLNKSKDENTKIEFQKEIDRILDSKFVLEFFHSSIWKDKYKDKFKLKINTIELLI